MLVEDVAAVNDLVVTDELVRLRVSLSEGDLVGEAAGGAAVREIEMGVALLARAAVPGRMADGDRRSLVRVVEPRGREVIDILEIAVLEVHGELHRDTGVAARVCRESG